MSIEQIIGLYKADISDHKAKIKELSGDQRKMAEEHLKNLEKQNKSLDDHIKMIGKVTIAIGAVTAAGVALWQGWEHNVKKAQLANNVLWSDVSRLKAGFGGLRSEMQTLETTNKLSHAAFKLTGDQMEIVGKSIRQLVREGASWEEATQKVTDSVVKLEGDALKDFGIRVRESKTDAEKFGAIMESLAGKAGKLTDATKTGAESMQAYQAKFTDAMDRIKDGLGRVAEVIVKIVDLIPDDWLDMSGAAPGASKVLRDFAPKFIDNIGRNVELTSTRLIATYGVGGRYNATRIETPALPAAKPTPAPRGDGKPQPIGYTLGDTEYGSSSAVVGGLGTIGGAYGGYGNVSTGMLNTAGWNAQLAGLNAHHEQTQSLLEKTFGPIEQFNAYSAALEGFTAVAQASFSAWIDGSKSIGAAAREAAASVLQANAVKLLGEAIQHGVYAVGSLAFGDLRGAAQHGIAAAKATAGAAALGILAKGLHSSSSGASSGGGGGAAPTGGGGGSGAAPAGGTYVITYNDSFATDSPLNQQRRARRMVESVLGSPGVK